jgi:hypothetical protein
VIHSAGRGIAEFVDELVGESEVGHRQHLDVWMFETDFLGRATERVVVAAVAVGQ